MKELFEKEVRKRDEKRTGVIGGKVFTHFTCATGEDSISICLLSGLVSTISLLLMLVVLFEHYRYCSSQNYLASGYRNHSPDESGSRGIALK